MFADKALNIALALSLITHGAILCRKPNLKFLPNTKRGHVLEVSYVKKAKEFPKPQARAKAAPPKAGLGQREPFLDLASKMAAAKMNPAPYIDKGSILNKNKEIAPPKYTFTKPAFEKPDIISTKKKISMPSLGLDKINNPSYISYYQIVREKIKRAAYQNYTRAEIGYVLISFLISADGSLKAEKLVEEKSSPSPYLKETALRSIKEASPFPGFPKELDYPQLSFNVLISFEIE